ncbi:MAG TPA: radical SAM protein [Anaerolineales bacterium]|nr:radical SAM protein [Anaerolineales bacterium]
MLSSLRKVIDKLNFRQQQNRFTPPPAGLYHYVREGSGEHSRIHLRLDDDRSGLLLVNANRVVHLNPTAALMAYMLLEELPTREAVAVLTRMYKVSSSQAKNDYFHFTSQLKELVRPEGACPIHELEIETKIPFSARPSAPYRMDLALTYRCNNDCAHCYNDRPRDFAELPTEQWKNILDKLWNLGIPHVVFTGGEPTLRNDLPELVAHAEANGQITGLNTNGRRLNDPEYLKKLIEAGLDHVQITVESHDPLIHDAMVLTKGAWKQTIAGVRNALDTPLYVMTNTTMLRENSPYMAETLDFLAKLGVPTIGLNALIFSGKGSTVGTGLLEAELPALLELARHKTDLYNQRLIWYTPTQYCHFDPMQLELGVKGCTAALYNMCIESDGSVIPCQSYYKPLGNINSDSWDSIWNHQLSISLRERHYIPEKCHDCVLLAECGGGCPLKLTSEDSFQ